MILEPLAVLENPCWKFLSFQKTKQNKTCNSSKMGWEMHLFGGGYCHVMYVTEVTALHMWACLLEDPRATAKLPQPILDLFRWGSSGKAWHHRAGLALFPAALPETWPQDLAWFGVRPLCGSVPQPPYFWEPCRSDSGARSLFLLGRQ